MDCARGILRDNGGSYQIRPHLYAVASFVLNQYMDESECNGHPMQSTDWLATEGNSIMGD